MPQSAPVLYQRKGHVSYITINRPERLNALSPEVVDGLREAFITFKEEREAWVAIWTGAGDRAFSAGADLKHMASRSPQDFFTQFWHGPRFRQAEMLMDCYKPVIAAINGYCLAGAFMMVLWTDIRIAVEHARFGYLEVARGATATGQGPARLPKQIPYAIAMEMLLTGEMLDAQEAHRIGLVNKVVPPAQLMPTAERYAQRICENPPLNVRLVKECALLGQDYPIEVVSRLGVAMSSLHRFTADAQEGPRAFAEKRKAVYRGE
ncbi:MAG: enoyl-CoA hydratase/isomerase family protein [Chloroflexi bacterium]|nr:enoyl-CoA hydratase/isomerase family protein [Chloroflexota bacterium]